MYPFYLEIRDAHEAWDVLTALTDRQKEYLNMGLYDRARELQEIIDRFHSSVLVSHNMSV